MALSFDQLQTYRAIVRAGSFSRAADELYLTQPAISQRVKHLEQAIGAELFRRDGNRRVLRLTPAGERVLSFAEEAVALLRRLHTDIEAENEIEQDEEITIACGPTAARYILPNLLTSYYERHPSIRVHLAQFTGDKIDALVRSGEADLGVRTEWLVDQRLEVVPLFRDRLVLIAPADHPAVEDPRRWFNGIGRCPFALTGPNSCLRQIVDQWAASLGLRLQVLVESNSLDAIKEAVTHGFGLALTSELTVLDELRDGRLRIVPAAGTPQEWQFCLIADPQRPRSPAARALQEIAREGTWWAHLRDAGAPIAAR